MPGKEENKVLTRRLFDEDLNAGNQPARSRAADELVAIDFVDHTNPPGLQTERNTMKRVKTSMLACMPMLLLTIVLLTTQVAQAAALNCGAWNVVTSPSPGGRYNHLFGVAAASASNVWAVGYSDFEGASLQTLTEQWNGTGWSVVNSPNFGCTACLPNILTAVAVGSANDIWTVGYHSSNAGPNQTLTEHWNGTTWSLVSSPNVGTSNNYLYGVTVISASNAWAVGYYQNSSRVPQTLVEHWNGTTWSVVASPSPGSYNNYLYGVTAVSASNVWAVGTYADTKTGLNSQTLVEHWNGASWNIIPSANAGGSGNVVPNVLNAVKAISASNIWAVGFYYDGSIARNQTLTERWNGTKWSVVPSPNNGTGGPSGNALQGIAVVSANDIWTAGYYESDIVAANQTLTEHWNGTTWSVVASPNVGTNNNYLYGIAAADASHIWAVGYHAGSIPEEQTLTEFYC